MKQRPRRSEASRFRLVADGPSAGALPSMDDEALIDAVRRGDHAAASIIYDRLFGVVDRTLYRMIGRRDVDHDDLIQQAFEQIVITLMRHAFAQMCSLRTWASRVTTNVALNALRSRRRERAVIDRSLPLDDEFGEDGIRIPPRAAESKPELADVRQMLAEMKPEQVEMLLLHDVMGHDLAELALMVGISISAAQSRLFRGRRELRQRIELDGMELNGGES